MSRVWIGALLIGCLVAGAAATQQKGNRRARSASATPPGVTTITSFDKEHTVVGWLEILPLQSTVFHNTRMLRVLVPANYFSPHNAGRSYPVLYMQDGQELFDRATSQPGEWQMDETVEHLVGSFQIPPMFVVGIDNAGEQRAAEYLPYPAPQQDHLKDEKSVHGKEYMRFLLTEVMPFVEKHYRIARGPQNTGLGGSSYGGDIALYTALQHPGVFGHLLVESPLLAIGNGQLLKDAERAKVLPRKLYVGVGTAESGDSPHHEEALKDVQELESILRKKGMGAARLKVMVEEGGQQNPVAWAHRLPEALLFLYGH